MAEYEGGLGGIFGPLGRFLESDDDDDDSLSSSLLSFFCLFEFEFDPVSS